MPLSYTRLTRFMENPARAFAHYAEGDKTAYDDKPNDALVYGTIMHARIADEQPRLTDDEQKLVYVRGKVENGLKKDYKTIDVVVESMKEQLVELYQKLGIDGSVEQPHAQTKEVEFKTDLFKGRYDYIDWKNKIIVDWKTVKGNVNFDKEWSDELGSYDTWIHATHYNVQAFLYLYSLMELTGHIDWRYYIVAASKSEVPKTRVIDMSGLLFDEELRDKVNRLMEDIQSYYAGRKKPELVNDNSDFYWSRKPFEIEVF